MPKRKPITGIRRKKMPARRDQTNLSSPRPSPRHRSPSQGLRGNGSRRLLSMRSANAPSKNGDAGRVAKPAYELFRPQLKYVSQKTVGTKWTVLDHPAQECIRRLLQAAEIPVLAKCGSEKSKVDAQNTLASLMRTVITRLPKMPFPPKTKGGDFDYDALVKSNRDLQQRLQSSTEVVKLLEGQAQELKRLLDSEAEEVKDLDNVSPSLGRDPSGYKLLLLALDSNPQRKDFPIDIGLAGSDND